MMKVFYTLKNSFIFFVILLLPANSAWAVHYYVNASGNCLNDGLSPASPKKTITCTLPVVYPGDTIHLAAGTYNLALGEVFPIEFKAYKHTDGVSVIGDGAATTFIDASGAVKTAIEIDKNTPGMTMENLTIQNVYTVGATGVGMAIIDSANVTVQNCVFKNNRTSSGGAGISCWGTDALITNNLFEGNRVEHTVTDGGGILVTNCSPTIKYNTFRNNYAGAGGGGIHCLSLLSVPTNPLIENNMFIGNEAEHGGGITFYLSKNPILRNNIIINNVSRKGGGGIFVFGGGTSPLVDSNIIAGNSNLDSLEAGGGIKASPGSTPVFKNNLIINNVSEGHGGGIFCENANITVTNCTLYNNEAKASTADGIWFWNGHGNISYSILWETKGGDVVVQGSATANIHHCDFEDTPLAGTGNFSSNPIFVTGPFSLPPFGDFYLAKDSSEGGPSPCIDAGDVTADSLGLSAGRTTRTDEIYDSGIIDLGFHYQSTVPTPTPSPTLSPTPTRTPVPVTRGNRMIIFFLLTVIILLCAMAKIKL